MRRQTLAPTLAIFTGLVFVMGCKDLENVQDQNLQPLTQNQWSLTREVHQSSALLMAAARSQINKDVSRPNLLSYSQVALAWVTGRAPSVAPGPVVDEERRRVAETMLGGCRSLRDDPTMGSAILPFRDVKSIALDGANCPLPLTEQMRFELIRSLENPLGVRGDIHVQATFAANERTFRDLSDILGFEARGVLTVDKVSDPQTLVFSATASYQSQSLGRVQQNVKMSLTGGSRARRFDLRAETVLGGFRAVGRIAGRPQGNAAALTYTINGQAVNAVTFDQTFAPALDLDFPLPLFRD